LNTCDGCHRFDTGTSFFHVVNMPPPANISDFLSGTGAGFALTVSDPQVSGVSWKFADLARRYQRLYDIAYCESCVQSPTFDSSLLDGVQNVAHVVPIDPGDPGPQRFEVGPISDLATVQQVLSLRNSAVSSPAKVPVGFIRRREVMSH